MRSGGPITHPLIRLAASVQRRVRVGQICNGIKVKNCPLFFFGALPGMNGNMGLPESPAG